MNKEELFDVLNEIDGEYISEAGKEILKKHTKKWIAWTAAAACFCLVIGAGIGIGMKNHDRTGIHVETGDDTEAKGDAGTGKKDLGVLPLTVSAAELGKEDLLFGATMPAIIYADEKSVIMYDYIGIWVYSLEKRELTGFCDFRPINMTQIQGEPCVFVEAASDGAYVKFFMSDESIKYIYDVGKNSYEQVDNYDEYPEETYRMENVTDEKSLSVCSETDKLGESRYIAYRLDIEDNNAPARYGDIVLIIEDQGEVEEYRVFGEQD